MTTARAPWSRSATAAKTTGRRTRPSTSARRPALNGASSSSTACARSPTAPTPPHDVRSVRGRGGRAPAPTCDLSEPCRLVRRDVRVHLGRRLPWAAGAQVHPRAEEVRVGAPVRRVPRARRHSPGGVRRPAHRRRLRCRSPRARAPPHRTLTLARVLRRRQGVHVGRRSHGAARPGPRRVREPADPARRQDAVGVRGGRRVRAIAHGRPDRQGAPVLLGLLPVRADGPRRPADGQDPQAGRHGEERRVHTHRLRRQAFRRVVTYGDRVALGRPS